MNHRKVILKKQTEEKLSFEEKLAVEEALNRALGTLDVWTRDYGAYAFVSGQTDLQATILADLAASLGQDQASVAATYRVVYD